MTAALRQPRTRALLYVALLLGLNFYFAKDLFFADFTNNMQTNAGSFLGISRFIQQHWPHLDWYPWWFAGEPFENSYTPMLHLTDAAFASLTGCSVGRAYNFVTALFFVTGPAFLFLFAWRVSRHLNTAFLASLLYSLFSPCVLFSQFRWDVGSVWNPWRMRVLAYYGEGPHTTVLSVLPFALLLVYLAIEKRRFLYMAGASAAMAFLVATNAFAAVDLGIGCVCLLLSLPLKSIPRAALLAAALATAAYFWTSPFLPPSLIHTIATNSQSVGGDYSRLAMLPTQCAILVAFLAVWAATRRLRSYFTRFTILFAFLFFAVVASAVLWNRFALPQPHRYALEMELALSLAVLFVLRPAVMRLPRTALLIGAVLLLVLAVHQSVQYRRYARGITQKIDVTQTIEYKVAKAIDASMGNRRAFVSAQAGTWLNAFSNTPQMNSGHDPFNPNWMTAIATYAIYSGQNAGEQDADISILWLKAFGCHAIYVPGPLSRLGTNPFVHPEKFIGLLPVLWHEEDDTIYGIPQRTDTLAHVVPRAAMVSRPPVNGLDTAETQRYVAALDDASLPEAEMTWDSPSHGRIRAQVRTGQTLSVQTTYDPGWVASANGRPAAVKRDGLGLTQIETDCNGACDVSFIFQGGLQRKICQALSAAVSCLALLGAAWAWTSGKLY